MNREAPSAPIQNCKQIAPRLLRAAQFAIVFLAMLSGFVFLGGRTIPRAWGTLQTDFPNYYIVAHLVREGYDTSRIYEWTWIQRQKDRLGIDQPIVGTTALTPFSFLTALPLTYFEPLTAKRIWTIFNLLFAAISAVLLKRISGIRWRWIALLFLLCLPLHTNIVLGQMYLLLLCVLASALRLHIRGYRFLAGLLIGIAAGMKVFPLLFLLYFLRQRDWRATTGLIVSVFGGVLMSAVVFGKALIWEYVTQQLPCAGRGESLDPYVLSSNSISSLLHRLFVFEPQLNPAPAFHAPWLMAVLLPIFQILTLAPVLLWVAANKSSERNVKVEWAAFTLAILTISTFPASYHFTLLLMPAALLIGVCLEEQKPRLAAVIAMLFVLIGLAVFNTSRLNGWEALVGVPRLYLLVLLCICGYTLLEGIHAFSPANFAWGCLLVAGCIFLICANLVHQRGIYGEYVWRIPLGAPSLLARDPVVAGPDSVSYLAMQRTRYAVLHPKATGAAQIDGDELSFAANADSLVVEQSGRSSRLLWERPKQMAPIKNAHNPALAADNSFVAFLRDEDGRGTLWIKSLPNGIEQRLADPKINVLDVTIDPKSNVIFSAISGGVPKLFIIDRTGRAQALSEGPDRFPSVSPDGRWLAFSRLDLGAWNLWVEDLQSRSTKRVTHLQCNQVTPSWEPDSRTLIYASDCGRGLLLTTLARRRVVF